MEVVFESQINELELVAQDEIRDIYALPHDKELIVYTDRISMFGYELDKPIPYRGLMLNQISLYWMNKFSHMAGHNIVAHQVKKFPPELHQYEKVLSGRSVIVQNLKTLPIYFRVIGNVGGEDWKTYKETGKLGHRLLSKGLHESDRLENPVFLPTPSEDLARYEIDDMSRWAQRMYGPKLYVTLEEIGLSVFGVARNYAAPRGLIIANTVFEFALFEGNPYFINQVMTPETSTFWSGETFERGHAQPRYEKEPLLNWLAAEGWQDNQPLPEVPQSVVNETSQRYRLIYDIMTGKIAKEKGEPGA